MGAQPQPQPESGCARHAPMHGQPAPPRMVVSAASKAHVKVASARVLSAYARIASEGAQVAPWMPPSRR